MRTVHGPRRSASVPPTHREARSFELSEPMSEAEDKMLVELCKVLQNEWKLLLAELHEDGSDAETIYDKQCGNPTAQDTRSQVCDPRPRPARRTSLRTDSSSDSGDSDKAVGLLPAFAVALGLKSNPFLEKAKGKMVLDFGVPGDYKNSIAFERALPGLVARQARISGDGSPDDNDESTSASDGEEEEEEEEETFSEGSTRESSEPKYDFPNHGVVPEDERDIFKDHDATERVEKWLLHVQRSLGEQPPVSEMPPIDESDDESQLDWEDLPAANEGAQSCWGYIPEPDGEGLLEPNEENLSEPDEEAGPSMTEQEIDSFLVSGMWDGGVPLKQYRRRGLSPTQADPMSRREDELRKDDDDSPVTLDSDDDHHLCGNYEPHKDGDDSPIPVLDAQLDKDDNEISSGSQGLQGANDGSESDSEPWWVRMDRLAHQEMVASYQAMLYRSRYNHEKVPLNRTKWDADLVKKANREFPPSEYPWLEPDKPVFKPYFTVEDFDASPRFRSEEEGAEEDGADEDGADLPPGPHNTPESSFGDLNSNDSIFSQSTDGQERISFARRPAPTQLGTDDDDEAGLPLELRYGNSRVELRLELEEDEVERYMTIRDRARIAGENAGEPTKYLGFRPSLPHYAALVEFAQFLEDKPADDEEFELLTECFRRSFKRGYKRITESWPRRKEEEDLTNCQEFGPRHFHGRWKYCRDLHTKPRRRPTPELDIGGISPMDLLEHWNEREQAERAEQQAERELDIRARGRAAGLIDGLDAYRKAAGMRYDKPIADQTVNREVALPTPAGQNPDEKTDWMSLQARAQPPFNPRTDPDPYPVEDWKWPINDEQRARLDQIFREAFNAAFEEVFMQEMHRPGVGPRFAPKMKAYLAMRGEDV